MTETSTLQQRRLTTREKAEDVAARDAIGHTFYISGVWASNTYWAVSTRMIEVVLDRAGLVVADGRYSVDGPGKVTFVGRDAPDIARLVPSPADLLTDLRGETIPGTSAPMMTGRSAGMCRVFARADSQLVAINDRYLSWVIGDAVDVSSPSYSPQRHCGYSLWQLADKPAGPVLVTTRSTYGAEHQALIMPVTLS